jgi:hypothetical protein
MGFVPLEIWHNLVELVELFGTVPSTKHTKNKIKIIPCRAINSEFAADFPASYIFVDFISPAIINPSL